MIMPDLQHRQTKIQERRKQTPFRQYLKEICSWMSLVLYRHDGLVSKFPDTERTSIMSHQEFEEYRDTLIDVSQMSFDSWLSFFDHRKQLRLSVKLPNVVHWWNCEEVDYVDIVVNSARSYLSYTVITDCEQVLYSWAVKDGCRNVLNSVMVRDHNENVYMSVGVFRSMNIFYSKNITEGFNIRFSSNLMWCKHCILCDNLTNKSYYSKLIMNLRGL